MSIFTSNRERRLWTWTAITLATIYATLGLAKTFASYLIERDLIDGAFALGMLLIGVALLVFAFKTKPSVLEIGVGIGIFAIYLLLFARMSIPEERTHLIEYSMVALLIYEALKERVKNGGNLRFIGLIAACATCFAGIVDELIQLILPSRVFDYRDIVFNCLAAIMAISGIRTLEIARIWWQRRTS